MSNSETYQYYQGTAACPPLDAVIVNEFRRLTERLERLEEKIDRFETLVIPETDEQS